MKKIKPLNSLYLGYEINEKDILDKLKKINREKYKILKIKTICIFEIT